MLLKTTGLTVIDLPILHPFSLPVYIPHLVAESLFYILSVLRIVSWQREGGAAKRSRFTRYTCLVKVIICVMIVWVLGPQESLVTPGDAVASFISVPDSYTADRLELLVKHPKHKADSGSPILWRYTPLRRSSCISRWTWTYTYAFFVACILVAAGVLGKEYQMIKNDEM